MKEILVQQSLPTKPPAPVSSPHRSLQLQHQQHHQDRFNATRLIKRHRPHRSSRGRGHLFERLQNSPGLSDQCAIDLLGPVTKHQHQRKQRNNHSIPRRWLPGIHQHQRKQHNNGNIPRQQLQDKCQDWRRQPYNHNIPRQSLSEIHRHWRRQRYNHNAPRP